MVDAGTSGLFRMFLEKLCSKTKNSF